MSKIFVCEDNIDKIIREIQGKYGYLNMLDEAFGIACYMKNLYEQINITNSALKNINEIITLTQDLEDKGCFRPYYLYCSKITSSFVLKDHLKNEIENYNKRLNILNEDLNNLKK